MSKKSITVLKTFLVSVCFIFDKETENTQIYIQSFILLKTRLPVRLCLLLFRSRSKHTKHRQMGDNFRNVTTICRYMYRSIPHAQSTVRMWKLACVNSLCSLVKIFPVKCFYINYIQINYN
jgi:hypothetical protein